MKQLNIQDAGFIYQETPFTPMHITGLGLYNQAANGRARLSVAETVDYISARLHNCPILSKKLFHVPGNWERPYWIKDPHFQVADHIIYHTLPEPGNLQQLHQLVSRLISTQLDMTKPLWECHVIEGLNDIEGYGANSFAILTKVHHSCIDGASGNNVITVLHDLEPNGQPFPNNGEEQQPVAIPGKYELMAKAYASNIWNGYQQAAALAKYMPAFLKVMTELYRGKIASGGMLMAPFTRFNKTPSTKRVFTSVDFNLLDIKQMKNVLGVTINDVMVAIVAGALREYLLALGELPVTTLGAMLPKNIRDEKSQSAKEGNQVGGLITLLHTDIEDPLERLRAIHASTQQAKAFSEHAKTDRLFPYLMGGFLYPRAGKALSEWAQKHAIMEKIGPFLFNTVITNVPGPNFTLYHAGAPMEEFSGVPPLPDGVGLAHAIYSYCGRINLSVLSCPLMLEDADFYAQCMKNSFNELQQISAGLLSANQAVGVGKKAESKKRTSKKVAG